MFERSEINAYFSILYEDLKQIIRTMEFRKVKFVENENDISKLLFMRQMADLANGMMILILKLIGLIRSIIITQPFTNTFAKTKMIYIFTLCYCDII